MKVLPAMRRIGCADEAEEIVGIMFLSAAGPPDGGGAAAARPAARQRRLATAPDGDEATTLFREGLVVLLDIVEIVEIVDHQAMRLVEPPSRKIAEPVEPFEPRAIAEMEARDRVERRRWRVRLQEIMGGGGEQRLLDRLSASRRSSANPARRAPARRDVPPSGSPSSRSARSRRPARRSPAPATA